jgi:hypothetical protein
MAHCRKLALALIAAFAYFLNFRFKEVDACHDGFSASKNSPESQEGTPGRRGSTLVPVWQSRTAQVPVTGQPDRVSLLAHLPDSSQMVFRLRPRIVSQQVTIVLSGRSGVLVLVFAIAGKDRDGPGGCQSGSPSR